MKNLLMGGVLLSSLLFQSTYPAYPAFESVKKRFGSAIAQAKELLNVRKNVRCMSKGDNCSKKRRVLLQTVSLARRVSHSLQGKN